VRDLQFWSATMCEISVDIFVGPDLRHRTLQGRIGRIAYMWTQYICYVIVHEVQTDAKQHENNDTTAPLLQPTAILSTCRCHIRLSRVKIRPPLRCGLSSKIFYLLYLLSVSCYTKVFQTFTSECGSNLFCGLTVKHNISKQMSTISCELASNIS